MATTDGRGLEVDFDQLTFADDDELLDAISTWSVSFETFDEVDADVDPGVFRKELFSLVCDEFGFTKKQLGEKDCRIDFREGGYLFSVAYWVFDISWEGTEETLYGMLVRDHPLTECILAEKEVAVTGDQNSSQVILSPAQAALFDLMRSS